MHSQSDRDSYPNRSLSQTSATTCSSRSTQSSDEKKYSRKLSNPLASKLFRPRNKSPSPIDIPKSHCPSSASDSHPRDISRSAPGPSYFGQLRRSHSPDQMSPMATSPQSPKQEYPSKRASTPTGKNSDNYRRYSGTINHYGRHSNDWLFGGFSVRETVRDGIDKLRSNDNDKES
ncbi:uncharacterized protein N7482_004003 [Penicillium canariense]|uniref:Uncharacterized protein n=1 Tax=Penicillium canariense TaxID=189055 RepID=A0A9W9I813_9EURO|nr:uncharacterized protein N7482_004003 [Penicillium canariense]KAJ5168409.1 hypothetical protein N7482_004003 [Penicillium canariense]